MIDESIAHYRITSKLGQGGMGEVYRATDTKLDRVVAIKILPESFAKDRDRVARFEREAKVLAALNHPNIAAIYGIEQAGDTHALVMELVEGETLGERLEREPMTVTEALDCCRQIAEALEAAHEKGIVHRDLKPENVKVDSEGRVKVLDFGLAKEVATSTESSNQDESPTITQLTTVPGQLLGTAPYMSPEQARAKPVDKRSDIWSFGCVLYECLTGKAMFQGDDVTETLATIIKGEPDWAALPADTPPTIELLLRKCLSKDRKRRLRDIGDARIDIEQALGDPSSSIIRLSDRALQQALARVGIKRKRVLAIVVGVSLVTAHLTWFIKPAPQLPPLPPRHSEILIQDEHPFTTMVANNAFALSRDGKRLVYNLWDFGGGLRIRDLETGRDESVRGAASANEGHPFFSWDGSQIGFVADAKLVAVPVTGGNPRVLGEFGINYFNFRGADWGENGSIVFAANENPLRLVSEEGGQASNLTELKGDYAHLFPQFLPGARHVLYVAKSVQTDPMAGRIEVVDLEKRRSKSLGIESCYAALYSQSGHLLYVVGNEVFAVAFDLDRMEVVGDRKRVLQGVHVNLGFRPQFDIADDGTLVYLSGSDENSDGRTLVWVDESEQVEPFTQQEGNWMDFALSPDQNRVALEIDGDIWVLDKEADEEHPARPLVTHEAFDGTPHWSMDGQSIFFYSDRGDKHAVWRIRADWSGSPAVLVCEFGHSRIYPSSASAHYLMMAQLNSVTGWDIWRISLDAEDARPEPFLSQAYDEAWSQISPDEKWLAYASAETDHMEIYVQPMDGSSPSRIVSTSSGAQLNWSSMSDEIYYLAGNTILSRRVDQQNGRIILDKTEKAFNIPFPIAGKWSLSIDNKRFLTLAGISMLDRPDKELSEPTYLKMISNWFTELNKKVPPIGAR